MSSRDLAATVRRVLDELSDEATLGIDEDAAQDAVAATCHEGQVALAALVKQAADAQASARAERHIARAHRDEMLARVRAEEALRQIAETARWYANNGDRLPLEVDHALCIEILSVAEEALAAAGADTGEETK